jgi:hypothetical protein
MIRNGKESDEKQRKQIESESDDAKGNEGIPPLFTNFGSSNVLPSRSLFLGLAQSCEVNIPFKKQQW